MALLPSCQFYPTSFLDSFQSSLSRFQGSRLLILRYASSFRFKRHNFSVSHNNIISDSLPEKNPKKNSRFALKNNNDRRYFAEETPISQSISNGDFSSNSWISKWNETHQQNLPKRPQTVLDYRNGGDVSSSEDDENNTSSSSGSSSTMDKIVEKLKRFGYVDDMNERRERVPEKGSVADIFYVEEGMLPNTRGGFSAESPLGIENGLGGSGEVRFPWEKRSMKEEEENNSFRSRSRTSLAELTLPESELRRLRNLAVRTKQKTKIKGAGVTQAVVDAIHEKWKTSEIVRLKCEGASALNMKRMHEILERKTGGLVIWRSGTSISLYRGVSYEVASVKDARKRIQNINENSHNSFETITAKTNRDPKENSSYGAVQEPQTSMVATVEEKKDVESLPEIKYEHEMDELLDSLGPRYTDWPGDGPLPVDADLLPGVVPNYKPPFRILPYGVRSTLGIKETTALRRLARIIPPHFALGRSRQHQGLAMAMIKLWERSSIAKIALKRGVQLTTSERMAEDIKKLTGATILSRNKDFIVFYRGKNFLSPDVTEALLERERLAKALQDEEEQARLRASSMVISVSETIVESGTAGTLEETLEADARWGKKLDDEDRKKMMRAVEVARHGTLVRKLERKLALAERKLMKAERALSKVEEFLKPMERPADPESITDEERFMFRKLGLRMKPFLLLGRRGVFDGTVENMHLHWKYRELVKILVKAKTFDQVRNIALALEAESGGILVSVDRVSKGFAIIVFRGKDYQRPPTLRPKNLLTKRKALARSIELQRHEALYKHISTLNKRVEMLRLELDQMEIVKDQGDEELYAKLDAAYPTEDEDSEDEGDEAYLETYDSDNNDANPKDAIQNFHAEIETNFPYDEQNWAGETDSEALQAYSLLETNKSCTRTNEARMEDSNFHDLD